jgi:outer membrane translocation and assembly module TamA
LDQPTPIPTPIRYKKERKHLLLQRNNRLSRKCAGLVSGANIRKGDTIKLFDVPFSQFIKIESDFRHYYKLGPDSQIASRIIAGAGFAYGNSRNALIKQFFIGGTNSLRAFRARSIGPGSLTVLQQIPIRFTRSIW